MSKLWRPRRLSGLGFGVSGFGLKVELGFKVQGFRALGTPKTVFCRVQGFWASRLGYKVELGVKVQGFRA